MSPVSDPQTGARHDALLTACPNCRRLVQLPSAISLDSLVQCPACNARYPVRSLLPDELPELLLVTGSSEPAPPVTDGHANTPAGERPPVIIGRLEVNEILRNGARRRRHRRSRDSSGEVPVSRPDSVQGAVRSSQNGLRRTRKRPNTSSAGRSWDRLVYRESRPRDPRMEMLKVIAGALAALPVAQLIIWWVLGVDPFRTAALTERIIPALVPPSLRAKEPGSQPTTGLDHRRLPPHRDAAG